MRYKKFGKTGLDVSVLTTGTWAIGGANWGEVNEVDSIAAIQEMAAQGVNLIDTAPGYNAGHSERVVGEAVRSIRDKVYLTTKTALYTGPDGSYIKDGRAANILRQCEESLKNLGTDYIDIYLIHWPDPKVEIGESMGAMVKLLDQGKIRHIGVSNFSEAQILEAEKYGPVEVIQPPFSMVNRVETDLMNWCARREIGIMTYGSLGAGILTGAIRAMPDFPPEDTRRTFYPYFEEPMFTQIMELLKTLDIVAGNHHAPVAQVALNWSIQKEYVHTAIVGVRNEKEAAENCRGMDWELSPEEIAMIDAAIADNLD
ncbi:aldo/keto reductase [Diplocloster agilis]|uniref:Aldo/keto reductase n=1 Tax=Diplocloster agilis TaxID=2850323 RepID=A0A949NFV6_9FIRM|nr:MULTISPECIES: aldo/keto reductase [Lachnospiraceae]MBU9735648.1 aldo/keto reductase [Diplocloster agilis]MCU6732386.1 aldo/keto reductase [Suonthocola fibrivorans]SCI45248.1 General stress protein 69 [uncultured Clostridium sp.]